MIARRFRTSLPRNPLRKTATVSLTTALLFAMLLTATLYRNTIPDYLGTTLRRKSVCLVYDKPPRTGSTTVAWALEACWSTELKFEHHLYARDARDIKLGTELDAPLSNMLRYSSRFVANIHRHVTFGDAEIDALRTGCDHVFFLTSTRPLAERLASAAKADATLRTFGKNKNVTLSTDMMSRALANIRGRPARRRAESYPNRTFTGSKKLDADYVIRSESLIADTQRLMRAFGCRGGVTNTNHHMAHDDADGVPASEKVYVDGGSTELTEKFLTEEAFRLFPKDERHDFYTKEANWVNNKGLVRAAELSKLRMDAMNAPLPE